MSTPPETVSSAPPIYSLRAASADGSELPPISTVDPENPPWGVLAAFITWFVGMAALALVPVLFVQPYVAYHYRGGSVPTQEALLANKTFVFLFVLGWVPTHLLTLALIWAVATRLGKYSLREVFGFSWAPDFGLPKSVGMAISLFLMAFLIAALFGGQRTDLDQILESSRAAALTLAFIAVVTAPLIAEMTYRGLLYSALQRAIGRWFAVFVVAAMFAGLHVYQYRQNIGAILSISLLSFVLTFIRARTGRLLPCFVIHLVFNGVQSCIIVLEPYLRRLLEHWQPKPTTGLLVYILHLLY